MAANKIRLTCLRLLPVYSTNNSHNISPKVFYCTNESGEKNTAKEVSRFSEFYEKEVKLQRRIATGAGRTEPNETFAAMLRKSKFIDLGDPVGKEVVGEIFHVVGDDLYIDFGWKFHTVCTAPRSNNKFYVKGAKVRLLIKELELSTKFLGSKEETTLLEADCVLLGLAREKKTFNK